MSRREPASEAIAVAHANIALAKYWGKHPAGERLPAVPSLSVTLEGLTTRTRVVFDEALEEDAFLLDGAPAREGPTRRVVELLDRVRHASGRRARALVESSNDFPTASGLASSASGFAALAVAAVDASGLTWPPERTSDLARRSSVSAARSVLGGFVELEAGRPGDTFLAARQVAPAEHLDLRLVVAVAQQGPKDVGSTEGMRRTESTSPFYAAWVADAPLLFAAIRDAVLRRDIEALGAAAEKSALRMHATMHAASPPLVYWTGATAEVLALVRRPRARGVLAYATIDAGPHVKVMTTPDDEAAVMDAVSGAGFVLRALATRPGGAAHVLPAACPG